MKSLRPLAFGILLISFASCSTQRYSDPNVIPNEILIDLESSFKPGMLEDTFAKYELKEKKVISPGQNIVLFQFNQEKIGVEKLIKKVKKQNGVEEAQSNKRTTKRR